MSSAAYSQRTTCFFILYRQVSTYRIHRNLFDSALMTATLESGRQKHIYYFKRRLRRNKTGREHEHIGIIMSPGKTCQFRLPAQCRTYTLMLIQSHANTVATATYGNPRVILARLNRHSTRMRKISIIATLSTIRAKITAANTLRLQISFDNALKLIARMVTAKSRQYSILKNSHKHNDIS